MVEALTIYQKYVVKSTHQKIMKQLPSGSRPSGGAGLGFGLSGIFGVATVGASVMASNSSLGSEGVDCQYNGTAKLGLSRGLIFGFKYLSGENDEGVGERGAQDGAE